MAVIDPWYDTSARFPIDDAKAVEEWGLATVISFCEKAQKKITENEDGFENEREMHCLGHDSVELPSLINWVKDYLYKDWGGRKGL